MNNAALTVLVAVKGFGVFIGCMWASQVVLVVKNLPASAGDIKDLGSIPVWGRSPGGGRGNPLQYSCLKDPMDGGAWQSMVHRVTKSQRGLKSLSSHTYIWCVIIIESESISLSVPCDSVVSRSWLTLCNPMDYSPSGSSVRGLLQASILEWGAMPFSRGSSQFRDRTRVSLIQADSVPSETLISNILF